VFLVTWAANVGSGALVYLLGRHYGRAFFQGKLGRKLLSPAIQAHVEQAYHKHGVYGIFLSRLLPVWRGVVMPFAGIAHLPAARALIPMAAASALYYGGLTFLVATLATNLDQVMNALGRVNNLFAVLGIIAAVSVIVFLVRRRKG
jgi:membrane protein DedA with SNARE-associated domain